MKLARFMVKYHCWVMIFMFIVFAVCLFLTFQMGLLGLTDMQARIFFINNDIRTRRYDVETIMSDKLSATAKEY